MAVEHIVCYAHTFPGSFTWSLLYLVTFHLVTLYLALYLVTLYLSVRTSSVAQHKSGTERDAKEKDMHQNQGTRLVHQLPFLHRMKSLKIRQFILLDR